SASYESFSLINVFDKGKSNKVIIESLVPHHRIIHAYPLIGSGFEISMLKKSEKINEILEIVKKYYDENGCLIVDKENPSSVEKFVEELIYQNYISEKKDKFKTPFSYNESTYKNYHEEEFPSLEAGVLELLELLPEKLTGSNTTEA